MSVLSYSVSELYTVCFFFVSLLCKEFSKKKFRIVLNRIDRLGNWINQFCKGRPISVLLKPVTFMSLAHSLQISVGLCLGSEMGFSSG